MKEPIMINCPKCGHRYILMKEPKKKFKCAQCGFSAPFGPILAKASAVPAEGTMAGENMEDKTRIDKRIVTENPGEKTSVVQGLQKPAPKGFQITFGDKFHSFLPLPPQGQFTLGRKSSDSTATVKVTPDPAMSRIHAGMRVIKGTDGGPQYQITSVKDDNPVFVNGKRVGKGAAVTLRVGDMVKMGETGLMFANSPAIPGGEFYSPSGAPGGIDRTILR